MQTPLSDVCTQGIFSNKSPSFIAILFKSQQNNTIFVLVPSLPRQSYSLYEKGATASSPSLFSHSATYTLLSHTAPCTNSSCTCISLAQGKKKKKYNPCLSACIPLKSLTLTAVHIYAHTAACHKLQRWDNQILLSGVVVF